MALFYLAAYPQYMGHLRDEVDRVVREHGWTKAALDEMHKVDSFLREVMRASGMTTGTMSRKAVKDYTFSDGTFIPAGTYLMAPTGAIYTDDAVYPNAVEFNPWRFSDMRDQDDFGHGHHACPGRFFAVSEMKTILAHIVATYDVKMEQEGVIPTPIMIGHICAPSRKAEILVALTVDAVETALAARGGAVESAVRGNILASVRVSLLRDRKMYVPGRGVSACPALEYREHLRVDDHADRRALTRLLCGDHPLAVEQLRQVSPPVPRDRRACHFCLQTGSVEDEAHVLVDCLDARLVALRDPFFLDACRAVPVLLHMRCILSSSDWLLAVLGRRALVARTARIVRKVFDLCAVVPL
ncbi:uncharacterized protein FIBRA_09612 [Fibroporia radiculosa]|uniref:Cytochrome P450 n=1 Tax=Fibroporia radiculosa TaxID=599839 RepID=J7S6Q6_9APHY|nr:uncharacterized protein FIBRA_09612 [Fibroporia radiculosa]CCM07264.1 predicted protein [Fibroporia radiculosa]